MHLIVVGLSHKTARIEQREKAALTEPATRALIRDLKAVPEITEAAALSTCNRTEVYLVSDDSAAGEEMATRALVAHSQIGRPELECARYSLRDDRAAGHLFRVAASLDSMVLGESEIQGQVRAAFEIAQEEDAVGPLLDRLFRQALEVGKRVRRETMIGKGAVSVSSVAVELAREAVADLPRCRALLIGAGSVAEATARALVDHGVRELAVVNKHLQESKQPTTDRLDPNRFDEMFNKFFADPNAAIPPLDADDVVEAEAKKSLAGAQAAALAAGLTALELGSDIAGSIRVPSNWCGTCGHKPSWGVVPQSGHLPPAPGALAATGGTGESGGPPATTPVPVAPPPELRPTFSRPLVEATAGFHAQAPLRDEVGQGPTACVARAVEMGVHGARDGGDRRIGHHRQRQLILRPGAKDGQPLGVGAAAGGEMDARLGMLAPDVRRHGDGGGKAQAIGKPVTGRQHVTQLLIGLFRRGRPLGVYLRLAWVNGQPGAVLYDPAGRVISVIELETVLTGDGPGLVQAIHGVANPDKLGGDRVSFYEFKSNRLVVIPQRPNSVFFSYLDAYSSNGKGMPYAFFSTYVTENNYNGYFKTYGNSDCATLGVWPYAEAGQPLPRYLRPKTFQIISAGADGQFGPGTNFSLPAKQQYFWTGATAVFIPNAGQDDQANFAPGLLSSGP